MCFNTSVEEEEGGREGGRQRKREREKQRIRVREGQKGREAEGKRFRGVVVERETERNRESTGLKESCSEV